jgi:hypothetical protein
MTTQNNHLSKTDSPHALNNAAFDIDAVILWVDGDDPAHKAKRQKYLQTDDLHQAGTIETRFRSVGEIDYCIRSILTFAPFIRNIYVVTDDQTPTIIKESQKLPYSWREKLHVVDHTTIFEGHEQYLPTFNSVSIETLMHCIPNLAEHFVAFNDDLFLIHPTTSIDFFSKGQPIHRGKWQKQPFAKELKRQFKKQLLETFGRKFTLTPSFTRAQWNAAKIANNKHKFFRMEHTPKPMRKSRLQHFFEQQPRLLEKNISYRSREASQFHAPSLACHLELNSGHGIETNDLALLYMHPQHLSLPEVQRMLTEAEANNFTKFACFQSLDDAPLEHTELIINWLDRILTENKESLENNHP